MGADQSSFASKTTCYFDDEHDHGKFDAATILASLPTDTHIYVCGPDGFIRYVVQEARTQGIGSDSIHREAFLPMSERRSQDCDFIVELASTGLRLCVPAGKSIVDIVEEAGLLIPTTCRQGICGMCITNVLAGTPDHRDAFLTDREKQDNDRMTPCCSRSVGSVIVLDL